MQEKLKHKETQTESVLVNSYSINLPLPHGMRILILLKLFNIF